jgi:putative holliday junction resolvase
VSGGRILGLDVGHVRIGVALSEPGLSIAFPHGMVESKSLDEDLEAIRALAESERAERIVVGLPLNQHGEPGPQAEKVLDFVERLRTVTDAEIVTQDERFTTALAERSLIGAKVRRKNRKKVIDSMAAQQILQTYLDREAVRQNRGGA